MTSTSDRVTTARTGTDAQRQELINDEDWPVRKAVAQYGTDAPYGVEGVEDGAPIEALDA